jgi:hypothetical protein
MENKTAIEWLIDKLGIEGIVWLQEDFEQAKEMEKEQIEDAFANGVDDEYEYHINNQPRTNSEQYYNETFKQKEQ